MTNAELADAMEAWLQDGTVHPYRTVKLMSDAIAALRQSSDKVLVPREPTEEMLQAAKLAFATIDAWCTEMQLARGRKPDWPLDNPPLKQAWRLMLAAAEAEGHHE